MISKLEIHNAAITVTSLRLDADDHGRIPDNLAKLTETLIGLHKANGDLSWLLDLVGEAEKATCGIRGE